MPEENDSLIHGRHGFGGFPWEQPEPFTAGENDVAPDDEGPVEPMETAAPPAPPKLEQPPLRPDVCDPARKPPLAGKPDPADGHWSALGARAAYQDVMDVIAQRGSTGTILDNVIARCQKGMAIEVPELAIESDEPTP
jgi:hypothetical protein